MVKRLLARLGIRPKPASQTTLTLASGSIMEEWLLSDAEANTIRQAIKQLKG